MDEQIRKMVDEIKTMPFWDAYIRAQGYEPVIMCNPSFNAVIRGMAFGGELKEYEESPIGLAGSLCGVKIVIMEKVNCPIIGFIKIFN